MMFSCKWFAASLWHFTWAEEVEYLYSAWLYNVLSVFALMREDGQEEGYQASLPLPASQEDEVVNGAIWPAKLGMTGHRTYF